MGAWLHPGLDAFRKWGQSYNGFYLNFIWMAVSKVKAYKGKEPAVTPISWEGVSLHFCGSHSDFFPLL